MFCGIGIQSNAQPLEFGISRGINISTHTEKFRYSGNYLTPKATTDLHTNLIVRKKLSSLRLQFEPSLTILGAKYDEPVTIQGEELQTKSETQLKYLQLPLLVQFPIELPEDRIFLLPLPTTYHLSSGIFWSYLLDARLEGTNTKDNSSQKESFSEDVIIQYSRYDGGVILGAGFEYGTDFKIGFETRVQYTALQAYNSNPRYRPKNTAVTFALYLLL